MRGEELLKQREQAGREVGFAEGHTSGLAEGLAAGRRDSLLLILRTKGEVSEALFGKISNQSDVEVLDNWISLACQISDTEEFERQISDDESEPI